MPNVTCKGLLFLAVMSVAAHTHGQTVAVTKMAFMSFTGTIEVKASPAQTWAALVEPGKAKTWYPGWKNATETQPLTTVGAAVSFVDEWNNAGKSVTLFVERNKELRVAHMPNDGSYVCQVKFKIEPKGTGTLVTIVDQYSDDLQVPLDKDTAAKVKDGMTKYLAALKATVEAPKK